MKIIFKILIGLFAGFIVSGGLALIPFLGSLSALFLAVSLLTGLIVYGFGNLWSAGCFMLVTEVMSFIIWGPVGAGLELLAINLPYAYIMSCMQRGKQFFKTLVHGFAAQILGLLAAIGLLALIYGTNLGDLAAQFVASFFTSLPVELRDSLANLYTGMYETVGVTLRVSGTDEILSLIAQIIGEAVKGGTTVFIVVISSVNALPGVLAAAYIRWRRNIPSAEYEAISGWRMPVKVIAGLIVLIVTGLILSRVNVSGEMVLVTVITAAIIACIIQYLASTYDKLSMTPMRTGGKITFMIVSCLLALTLVIFYGALSMLIGSHGLITEIRKSRANKQ